MRPTRDDWDTTIYYWRRALTKPVLTAQVMLAAARALPQSKPGAYLLTEFPLSEMWGERAEKAHRDWL